MGPLSIAGLNGPDRNEFDQLYAPPVLGLPDRSAGEVRAATDGSFPDVSAAGLRNDSSKRLGSKEYWPVLWLTEK